MPMNFNFNVLAVCGSSCCGKSTLTSVVTKSLRSQGCDVAVITADDYFNDGQIKPQKAGEGSDAVTWLDWESADSMKWDGLIAAIEEAKKSSQHVIVEGFLLFSNPDVARLFDSAVFIIAPKDVCWKRRVHRAKRMQEGPAEDNYERIEVYTQDKNEQVKIRELALRLYGEEVKEFGLEEWAWLRLYFEQMIWPHAMVQINAMRDFAAAQKDEAACLFIEGDISCEDCVARMNEFFLQKDPSPSEQDPYATNELVSVLKEMEETRGLASTQ